MADYKQIADHLTNASTALSKISSDPAQQQSFNRAILSALLGLKDKVCEIDEREERRAEYVNRLMIENMFAVVRLEIATVTDQIINTAIAIKRDITGTGKAELVFNVAGTLAMLAGNVLTAGGMSLLGNLIVAAGEMVVGGAKNSVQDVAKGIFHFAGHATTAGVDGKAGFAGQTEYQMAEQFDVEGNKVETRTKGEGIGIVINTSGDTIVEVSSRLVQRYGSTESERTELFKSLSSAFTPTRKKTFFVEHGAGGSSAITHDVQQAIVEAYGCAMAKIEAELIGVGQGGKATLGPNSILAPIIKSKLKKDSTLHPVTAWVIGAALKALATSGGSGYSTVAKVANQTTKDANARVQRAYGMMFDASTSALLPLEALREKLLKP